jgi:hypothetical protein
MRTRFFTCVMAFAVAAPAVLTASAPASAQRWHRGFGPGYYGDVGYYPDFAYGYPGYYPYGPSYVRAPPYAYAPDYQPGDHAIEDRGYAYGTAKWPASSRSRPRGRDSR